jgi:zinc transporter
MGASASGRDGQATHAIVPLAEGVIPGLVLAFRIQADGTAHELPVDQRIDLSPAGGGWLWLHFNLADKRAGNWIANAPLVPASSRGLLIALHDHQQLYATGDCVYGVFSDLIRNLDSTLDETGYLNFAMTDRLVVTGRRQSLQAVEATHLALLAGRKVATGAALIEGIVNEAVAGIDRLLDGLGKELDQIEDQLLVETVADERRKVGRVRRTGVRLHRQLAGLRGLLNRFEVADDLKLSPAIELATDRLVQRLDGLDQEVVAVQERARLLQEEISARLSEESARNLNVLAILSAVFLPATLVTGVFGMNTTALPLTDTPAGSLWAIGLVVAAAVFAYWLLRRIGVIKRQ